MLDSGLEEAVWAEPRASGYMFLGFERDLNSLMIGIHTGLEKSQLLF